MHFLLVADEGLLVIWLLVITKDSDLCPFLSCARRSNIHVHPTSFPSRSAALSCRCRSESSRILSCRTSIGPKGSLLWWRLWRRRRLQSQNTSSECSRWSRWGCWRRCLRSWSSLSCLLPSKWCRSIAGSMGVKLWGSRQSMSTASTLQITYLLRF